jgi:DNA modification methylase
MPDPFYQHAGVTIHHGNALDVLRSLPEASVNCCITSPPYWGLRDYGTGVWSGGDQECTHAYNHGVQGKGGDRADRTFTAQAVYRGTCGTCGAVRVDEQIGLEETPALFVGKMVEIFAQVRRVLRDDGTVWLNLGDSYSAHAGQRKPTDRAGIKQQSNTASVGAPSRCAIDMKPKDLCGIPWRVAFALQGDGWYLRQDIVWHKPNPMPESVTDRCTKAHEYIFLLSKSQRYYFDAEAIQEPATGNGHARGDGVNPKARWPSGWDSTDSDHHQKAGRYRPKQNASFSAAVTQTVETRNKRSVWTVATEAFPESHFATFPKALILPCVLAGCPAGGLILDPFTGAATTALVAKENGRNFVGAELKLEYCEMAARRLSQGVLFGVA